MEKESFWNQIDSNLKLHKEYILSDEQRKIITAEEQKAYTLNIESIKEVITEFEQKLKERNFWTESQITEKGFKFRFSLYGYYGPAGFSSQYHFSGPLILGIIDPKSSSDGSFYKNNLEENIEIGCNYDKKAFINFIEKIILDYTSTNNLLISKDQYDYLRNFKVND